MTHEIKKRVRELVAQVAEELRVEILNGVVSSDHVHIFAEIPPHIPVSAGFKPNSILPTSSW
jgi:putative transposase